MQHQARSLHPAPVFVPVIAEPLDLAALQPDGRTASGKSAIGSIGLECRIDFDKFRPRVDDNQPPIEKSMYVAPQKQAAVVVVLT